MMSIFRSLAAGSFVMTSALILPTTAFAITSCWEASDPPGCTLQCWFGGPCPLESISGQAVAKIDFKLPSPKSEMSQKVSSILKERGGMDEKSLERSRSNFKGMTLVQTCEPEKLLDVMATTASPQKIAKACFIKK